MEQSPQGTYQSSALCVGKNPTCTWCRSLYWSRTRSSLSCTLEEEREKEDSHQCLSNRLIWSWSRAKGFGESGILKGLHHLSRKKKKKKKPWQCPVNHFSQGVFQVYFRKLVLPFSTSCSCSEWGNQRCEHNSRDSKVLCHDDLFEQAAPTCNNLDTNHRIHVFSTNGVLQQEGHVQLEAKCL